MTGTADTEAVEFKNIYKLDVAVIPPNKPNRRTDLPPVPADPRRRRQAGEAPAPPQQRRAADEAQRQSPAHRGRDGEWGIWN